MRLIGGGLRDERRCPAARRHLHYAHEASEEDDAVPVPGAPEYIAFHVGDRLRRPAGDGDSFQLLIVPVGERAAIRGPK